MTPTSITRTTILTLITIAFASPALATSGPWLDRDGEALPFQNDDQLLAFLADAPIVHTKVLDAGTNRAERLTLARDGVQVRAIFRTVDVERPDRRGRIAPFRDSFRFEAAAYELSRLLGLDHVPPTTLRTVAGRSGSIQLWIERAHTEGERLEARRAPSDPAAWHLQRQMMLVFDNLIFNFDRNHGNILHDPTGKVWFVDHTRSFKRLPTLPAVDGIRVFERSHWRALRTLDPATVRTTLSPYLEPLELHALLERHRTLVRRIASMIEQRGDERVLFAAIDHRLAGR